MTTTATRPERPVATPVDAPDGAPVQHAARQPRPMNAAMLFTVVALTIAVVGLLYLIQTAQVASLGYEVTRLEQERAQAALENQRLTYEVARYEALPRVEELAVGPLGMQPLGDHIFIVVPRPSQDELTLPSPVEQPEDSLARRVWERLTGKATATNAGGGQ